jgi:hypothetical protein
MSAGMAVLAMPGHTCLAGKPAPGTRWTEFVVEAGGRMRRNFLEDDEQRSVEIYREQARVPASEEEER